MFEFNYVSRFDIRKKRKIIGWFEVRSNLKPDRFLFHDDMLTIEFPGYAVYVHQDQTATILKFPWAKEEFIINKFNWMYLDKEKCDGLAKQHEGTTNY